LHLNFVMFDLNFFSKIHYALFCSLPTFLKLDRMEIEMKRFTADCVTVILSVTLFSLNKWT
jgi:hypothetical protein